MVFKKNFQIPGAASLTPLTSPLSPNPPSVIGSAPASSVDLLCDLGGLDLNKPASSTPSTSSAPASDDPWGDFASADSGAKAGENICF